MTEHRPDDVLARLRAVDPVPEPVSDPSDGPVRATLEEILMTTTTTTQAPPRTWWRDPRILAAAAAFVLLAGVLGAIAVGGDDEAPLDTAAPTAPDGEDPAVSGPSGDPGAGDTQLTQCVAQYDLQTLTEREYAFDGTVASVDGRDMTFTVHEWFHGGEGATVTLDHGDLSGMLFTPNGPSLEPGTRALVAGDGGFVWSCGFTQLHDPAVADQWRDAFAG